MANSKLNITLKVDGRIIPLVVNMDSDDEVAYRTAAKILNKDLSEFRSKYANFNFEKDVELTYLLLEVLKERYLEEKEDAKIVSNIEVLSEDLSRLIDEK